ncbi:MAG: suppressor of fused domain protein [Novosphingobium sp.]
MFDEPETSLSGSPVYRYGKPVDWEYGEPTAFAEAIEAHVEKYIGPVKTVFHEVLSNQVHVDVLSVEPTDGRPFWTFVSCGMSARPMQLPDAAIGQATPFAEVVISLPADWQFSSGAGEILGNHQGDYPISLLRYAAHFPHNYSTWLGAGHTIPNGDPPQPLSERTAMCGIMLTPVLGAAQEFNRLIYQGGQEISFLGVIPLYNDELDLKLRIGADELYALFDANGVSELYKESRPSVVSRSSNKFPASLFGLGCGLI